jgi:hypothetical protein
MKVKFRVDTDHLFRKLGTRILLIFVAKEFGTKMNTRSRNEILTMTAIQGSGPGPCSCQLSRTKAALEITGHLHSSSSPPSTQSSPNFGHRVAACGQRLARGEGLGQAIRHGVVTVSGTPAAETEDGPVPPIALCDPGARPQPDGMGRSHFSDEWPDCDFKLPTKCAGSLEPRRLMPPFRTTTPCSFKGCRTMRNFPSCG